MDFEDKAVTALVGVGCLLQIAPLFEPSRADALRGVFAIKWLAGNA